MMKFVTVREVRYLFTSPSRQLIACNNYTFARRHGQSQRAFRSSPTRFAVRPYLLADIGEGITECQIMSWFVQPGDRVAQFDRICEVQSDKASVEITSRFNGVVKVLHYEVDDMAAVGQPLIDIDIDIEDDITEDEDQRTGSADPQHSRQPVEVATEQVANDDPLAVRPQEPESAENPDGIFQDPIKPISPRHLPPQKHANALTPGVRHMLKKLNLDANNIQGTGRDGRVLKEDIQRYESTMAAELATATMKPNPRTDAEDRVHTLNPIEMHMFKVMTGSLSIPHFLYTHTIDVTELKALRQKYAASKAAMSESSELPAKLTPLPFIMKAISQSFLKYPQLNSHLDTETNPQAPRLLIKGSHNFGIAVDTPNGLLVPVVRDVQNHSIISLALEISRLGELAQEGRLAVDDFKRATYTISNIGSIGGGVVSPVIVAPMTGILGIGKSQSVLALDENNHIVKREQITLSWSADHRILDGAVVAKCAEAVSDLLSNPDTLGLYLR